MGVGRLQHVEATLGGCYMAVEPECLGQGVGQACFSARALGQAAGYDRHCAGRPRAPSILPEKRLRGHRRQPAVCEIPHSKMENNSTVRRLAARFDFVPVSMPEQDLNTKARDALVSLAKLVDQDAASVLVEPQQNADGFWFGSGNLIEPEPGRYLLCGRYRNRWRLRTEPGQGAMAGFAIFRGTTPTGPFTKIRSFTKQDLCAQKRRWFRLRVVNFSSGQAEWR